MVHFPWVYRSKASYADERAARHRGLHERLDVLEVLVTAVDRRDEVIAAITSSASPDQASSVLVDLLGVSELGSYAVLDLQLRQLVQLNRERLVQARDQARDELAAWDPDQPPDGPRWIRRGWFAYEER